MADYIDAFRDTGSAQKFHPCSSCGRTFNPSTLARHESVCQNLKKRQKFDSSKQRLENVKDELANIKVKSSDLPPKPKKANWRQKHEEFISTIRGARGVTAAQKKGEPLPPPPPPTINPDYVQCPHCSRRFNEHAAERHINFCKEQRARIARPGSKTTAAVQVARRTQYKPPLPGKRNSAPSSAVQSSRATGPSSAKLDYRATEYATSSKTTGSSSRGSSGRNPTSASPSNRRKLLSNPDLRSKAHGDQRNKWSPAVSPSLSRRKPSGEANGIGLPRTRSGDVFSYFDSDDDIPVKPREVKHGRRNNLSDSENERGDPYVYDPRHRRERPDSNSSENSERASSGSSTGRRHRNIAIRDPSPTLFDDFGIQSQSPISQKNPFSAKPSLHKDLSEDSRAVAKPKAHSAGKRLSKFCHECGTKYPVSNAKFCCECGTKRLYIEC